MMTNSETLRVDLNDRSYDIIVGANLIPNAGEHIPQFVKRDPAIIVTDVNVAELHLENIVKSLQEANITSKTILLPAGENTKSYEGFCELLNDILDTGIERRSCLIALGGGVIGDITGFAASVLLRGIDFIQIPTTLLAQVDSSVGGKTGINTQHGKNLVGSFYQPRLVLADTTVLDTLPRRELLAGYSEIVKYGLLGDRPFFEWLEENGHSLIEGDEELRRKAIVTSCSAKASIVAQDEKESGSRALLNLGHTFGHALEAETGFGDKLLHGEAVSIGMTMAFDLSARMGLCSTEDAARVRKHLNVVGLPVDPTNIAGQSWKCDALLSHMAKDKKVRDGKMTFILPRGIGDSFITSDVDLALVEAMLDDAIAA